MKKLQQITVEDVLFYGNEYGIELNEIEAEAMASFIKDNKIDPFNKGDREKTFKELETVVNITTAKKARELFEKLSKSYGLDYLFSK